MTIHSLYLEMWLIHLLATLFIVQMMFSQMCQNNQKKIKCQMELLDCVLFSHMQSKLCIHEINSPCHGEQLKPNYSWNNILWLGILLMNWHQHLAILCIRGVMFTPNNLELKNFEFRNVSPPLFFVISFSSNNGRSATVTKSNSQRLKQWKWILDTIYKGYQKALKYRNFFGKRIC